MTIAAIIFFGCLLFRSGRAEIRSNNEIAKQAKKINELFELAENALAQGKFEEAQRLAGELQTSFGQDKKPRLDAINARAELDAKLHPGRIKEANQRVSELVTIARNKLVNLNDVSEEAEQTLTEAFAVPLATHLAAARDLANEPVRRRVATAQSSSL